MTQTISTCINLTFFKTKAIFQIKHQKLQLWHMHQHLLIVFTLDYVWWLKFKLAVKANSLKQSTVHLRPHVTDSSPFEEECNNVSSVKTGCGSFNNRHKAFCIVVWGYTTYIAESHIQWKKGLLWIWDFKGPPSTSSEDQCCCWHVLLTGSLNQGSNRKTRTHLMRFKV